MSTSANSQNRRNFLKTTALGGGGLLLGFNWLTGCTGKASQPGSVDLGPELPESWHDINAYLKIGNNGTVTIYTPNPEFGQGVMTAMPMILAEELDVDWKDVISEQAPFNAEKFGFQFTGGSRGIMSRWAGLRQAGATARQMLIAAAAQEWEVPAEEITTKAGRLYHAGSDRAMGYGDVATVAAELPMPEEAPLKDLKDFSIIGKSKKNVQGREIVTGKPLFGIDYHKEGMLTAMIVHPPSFGQRLERIRNLDEVKAMPGIKDVFAIKTYKDGQEKGGFDTNAFPELVAVVGDATWRVMKAKKALLVDWQEQEAFEESINGFRGKTSRKVPAGLENSAEHSKRMEEMAAQPAREVRKDGNPELAFRTADRVLERSYSAPFLAHNCMEPMNAFAHVEGDQVWIAGPLQAPGLIEPTIAARMDLPVENIDIEMTRMGGGFGRRAYSHYMLEAALISKEVAAPVKLIYSREDDMTNGIYRPTYQATYRAAIDANGELTALHVKAGGIPESPLFANRFPAGSIDNYLAEEWSIDSNITIGAFRAPRSNFMAGAEQAFLDELAEELGKDPIDFRLELLQKAKDKPVGERNDYDPERYAGVLKLVRDKSGWGQGDEGISRGVSAYFCHNSYAAHVLDLTVENGKPVVQKVTCAIDCGVVVNPDAAANMAEGGIVDGVGNAFFGEMTFTDGKPDKQNFDSYRMIRMSEAPKVIDVHFVASEVDPTGLGEPPFPPVFGAVANAIYRATGERRYKQPFMGKPLKG
ncbi:xanthine dehydrogenase family protein molybdopterin-binding subunit [Neolewinella agarilytica]|uniref:Isoquinoline 1-oxidoreductase, beta subunit n=1 Tax=Neolewinella agarilytica TaxID=478744 RepID=A0A1H9LPU9_9BACT|nr:molybdopterin cofactor-binding domain-containing protein [Neolewinella agarilytica]SER13410.1 isoquinoline 1-oxidoreductase, beta subunit [Neolewinella agarilytica]